MNITDFLQMGSENATSRKRLCAATGLSDRIVRRMIEEERRNTIIISNDDGSGYWIFPDDPTEEEILLLKKYVKQQENRAKSIFYALYPARQMMKGAFENGCNEC